jgi:hypothetical protein
MTFGKPFEPGREKTGGRKPGARNKLSHAFLEAFAKDFEEHGADVIKIVRMEEPARYLQVAALLMPKAFDDEMPAVVQVITGVPRRSDDPSLPNTPPAALPAPKAQEPEAVACPLTSADMVAELPKSPEPARAEPAKAEAPKPTPIEYEFNPPWR